MKTIEELINDEGYPVWYSETSETEGETVINYQDCKQIAIEFAKIHVEAALKKATHVLDVNNDADYIEHPTPRRILNSYPLTNIK